MRGVAVEDVATDGVISHVVGGRGRREIDGNEGVRRQGESVRARLFCGEGCEDVVLGLLRIDAELLVINALDEFAFGFGRPCDVLPVVSVRVFGENGYEVVAGDFRVLLQPSPVRCPVAFGIYLRFGGGEIEMIVAHADGRIVAHVIEYGVISADGAGNARRGRFVIANRRQVVGDFLFHDLYAMAIALLGVPVIMLVR